MKNILLYIALLSINQLIAQDVNIPNAQFKNILVNGSCVDTNLDGAPDADADINNDGEIQITEAEAVIGLYVNNQGISDLTGIEAFINLEFFDCSQNFLGTMDISQNTKLKELDCSNANLSAINLNTNTKLVKVVCRGNNLTSINLNTLTDLVHLTCSNNNISNTINIDNNILLELFNVAENNLTSLNTSQNVNLKSVELQLNQVGSLDLINNPLLEYIGVQSNLLTSVNLSNNVYPNLINLNSSFNLLTELDLSTCTNLKTLFCGNNPNLENLNVNNNYNPGNLNYNFSSCPNLTFVCSDAGKMAYIQDLVDSYGYTNTTVSSNCNLSVDNIDNSLTFSTFPNPVLNILNIDSKEDITTFSIYNINGKLVKRKALNALKKKVSIDVNYLSSGVYIITIQSVNFSKETLKFIKL